MYYFIKSILEKLKPILKKTLHQLIKKSKPHTYEYVSIDVIVY